MLLRMTCYLSVILVLIIFVGIVDSIEILTRKFKKQ